MTERLFPKNKNRVQSIAGYLVGLLPFVSLPVLGSMLYLRRDDSSWLLWAKKFSEPLIYALSPDPAVNMTRGYVMEIYWRPFINLYMLFVYRLFGPSATGIYHVFACITFIAAVWLLLRLAHQEYNLPAAVLTGLLFFGVFNGVMYNLFHVGVPVSFLFQMALIYFFWRALRMRGWTALIAAFLFLIPAMARQTTPILLAGLFIAHLLTGDRKGGSWKMIPALIMVIAAFYMLGFSSAVQKGTALSLLNQPSRLVDYLTLRIHYYGSFLSSGISGFFILLLLSSGVFARVQAVLKWEKVIKGGLFVLPSLLCTVIFLKFPTAGIYWIFVSLLFLFIAERNLRMPLAWAGASMAVFFSVSFYHMGYLVEAAFPLSIVLALMGYNLYWPLLKPILKWPKGLRFGAAAAAGLIMIILTAALLAGVRIPYLYSRLETVLVEVEKNRNFHELMEYITTLPENSVIYELNEYDLGLTGSHKQFLTQLQRAERAKVMSIDHKKEMFALMDRPDIQLIPAWQIEGRKLPEHSLLITCTGFERKFAENRYDLHEIRTFGDSNVHCAVFRPAGDADGLIP